MKRARCSPAIAGRPALQLVAMHVHVGSQMTTVDPLRRAAAVAAGLAAISRPPACALEYLDVGGGLGISYDGQRRARRRRNTPRR